VSIVVSPQAQADLREVRRYIARDNPAAARREIARIKAAIKMLAGGGVDGREVCLESGERVHLWLVSSYRLYYRRLGKVFQVIRVYHHARSPIER
jgi:plasmid stabilization system protein ParE